MTFKGCDALVNGGIQIGGGSVTIFLLVSAWLYGSKWHKDGFKSFDTFEFLKKRCLRIFLPLWILLLGGILCEYYIVGRFEVMTIAMNAVGLGWAEPFGTAGHLWYITMVLILYASFLLLLRVRIDRISWRWWWIGFIVLAIGYCLGQGVLNTYSKAGPPMFLFFSTLMFARGKEVIETVRKHKVAIVLSTIIMIGISMYVYMLGCHDSHKSWTIGSFICAGFLSFVSLYSMLNITHENKFVKWLSGISYEAYLVHNPLIAVCAYFVHDKLLWTIVWIIASLACSVVLNKMVNLITQKSK